MFSFTKKCGINNFSWNIKTVYYVAFLSNRTTTEEGLFHVSLKETYYTVFYRYITMHLERVYLGGNSFLLIDSPGGCPMLLQAPEQVGCRADHFPVYSSRVSAATHACSFSSFLPFLTSATSAIIPLPLLTTPLSSSVFQFLSLIPCFMDLTNKS